MARKAKQPRQGESNHYLAGMRTPLVAFALFACSMVPARADDCDALAAQTVSKYGASVERRSEADYIMMHHPAVRSLGISCERESSPRTVFISIGTAYPSRSFYDLASQIAADATGGPAKTIQALAQACQQRALRSKDETERVARSGLFVECQAFTRDGGDTSLTIGKGN